MLLAATGTYHRRVAPEVPDEMEPRLRDVHQHTGHELQCVEALLGIIGAIMTGLVAIVDLPGAFIEPQPLEAYGRPQEVAGQPLETAPESSA